MTTHGGLWRSVYFGAQALYADTTDREEFGIALSAGIEVSQVARASAPRRSEPACARVHVDRDRAATISAVESRGAELPVDGLVRLVGQSATRRQDPGADLVRAGDGAERCA